MSLDEEATEMLSNAYTVATALAEEKEWRSRFLAESSCSLSKMNVAETCATDSMYLLPKFTRVGTTRESSRALPALTFYRSDKPPAVNRGTEAEKSDLDLTEMHLLFQQS
jgi:hypothetical protein